MERKRDEATIEKLKQLRQKLMSENISYARVAAFQLSWLQEDGMAVLQEALYGDYSQTTKRAAAYGMRSMRGRMKKMAVEVLEKGVQHQDRVTQNVSKTSLGLMRGEITIKPPRRKSKPYGKRPRSNGSRNNGPQSNRPQSKGSQSKREIRSIPSEPNGNLKSYKTKPTSR